ncbi:hypothetical protein M408DRAFT_10637 [Serendipita vermifera MAFF 305830]|uniref:Alpha/beta hydrolase fold-3 domain-containing protein n=1 Tax=Serendipita vermifera MAFF 305830 TaxID=933852 RepID=A0A0C2WFC6_SERVB|nr:hypothetical protein M408DRAFT_10637 [Serendipita vermifera MAFF 305830]
MAKLFRGGFILGSRILSLLGRGPVIPPGLPVPHGEPLTIRSSKTGRRIRVTVYKNEATLSAAKSGLPSAVHIHFYGGGWMLPYWAPQSKPLIATIFDSVSTPLTIIDASYALAPEHSCPAELEDGREIYDYVCAHPEMWDKDKITLSGCSSGGAIVLGLAVTLGKEAREAAASKQHADHENPSPPSHPIKGVVVYYAMTNWIGIQAQNKAFFSSLPSDAPRVMPPFVLDTIQASHFFSRDGVKGDEETKRKEELQNLPSVSPALADAKDFPPRVGIWTVQWDVMSISADELRERLKQSRGDGGDQITGRRIMGVGHGWDLEVREGQFGWEERGEAYKDLADIVAWASKVHVE